MSKKYADKFDKELISRKQNIVKAKSLLSKRINQQKKTLSGRSDKGNDKLKTYLANVKMKLN